VNDQRPTSNVQRFSELEIGRWETPADPPAIRVGGLRIWIHGYQFPESTDVWDGNRLRVTAYCAEPGASVVVTGSVLETSSFFRFHRELVAVYERLQGTATLDCHEPDLKVNVQAVGSQGEMHVQIDITPDHLKQAHRFLLTFDQSYLAEIIQGCRQLLDRYPMRS
jgi:hypothetical protein